MRRFPNLFVNSLPGGAIRQAADLVANVWAWSWRMGGVGTLGITLWLPGCAPPSPHPRAQSEADLRQATAEIAAQHYEGACQRLDQALARQTLPPDQTAEALLHRARCLAKLGQFALAESDLQRAAPQADPAAVLATQAFVLRQQGKLRQAEHVWRRAKQINPHVLP